MPGICPECGMKLVEGEEGKVESGKLKDKNDHNKHLGHKTGDFLKKFVICLSLTIPILGYSDLFRELFNFQAPVFPGSNFISLIFGSTIFFYGGSVFIVGAWRELKAKMPGMMTLISLAISVAYVYSVFIVLAGREGDLFWELATLITIMLIGHYMEMKSVAGAQSALRELSKLLPDVAEILTNKEGKVKSEKLEIKIVPITELKIDDIIFVRPGGRVPIDGVVVDGKSDVDESLMTGESSPVSKNIGSQVIAGSINGDGALKIKVLKIGEQTFLAGVMRLVAEAQASKSHLQILSDKAAFYLTVIAIVSATVTFVFWAFIEGDFIFSIERAVAVLVIACPHALGLAVPLVASISTTLAASKGFLVRQRLALEMARKIDIVLFDKTGTLTKGEYGVSAIISNQSPITNDQILQIAASVDVRSEHHIAKAIVAEAKNRNLELLEVKDFSRVPGRGVRGIINGEEVLVGGASILDDEKMTASDDVKTAIEKEGEKGRTIIYVFKNKEIVGIISLGDVIRAESKEAVEELKKMEIGVAMITGDSDNVAKWVARELGIDEYYARVLPGEKTSIVKNLQQGKFESLKFKIKNSGQKPVVAMVGDGINDAPALTQADIGIAIGAGANVAIESAGIILFKNNPRDIVKIINLSKATYRKMIQNLFWATGYNVVALPLAAGILASKGILLAPALAAVFMSASTIVVAINALLLRRANL